MPLRPSVADDLGSLASAFAAPAPAPVLAPGTVIGGHFELEGAIGRGGMGAVYRALDRRLGRRVAIKIGLPGAEVGRAQREAAALARLAHPNVVTLLEIGAHDGAPFVAMELCDGGTAAAWARAAPRGWREVLAVYAAAGRGLAAAHAVGLVHRDVKPENILLGEDGRPRIADFGLARAAIGLAGGRAGPPRSIDPDASTVSAEETGEPGLDGVTAAGAIVGTPRYLAPEQLDGRPLDARTDQFAFCVALYEALAHAAPFPADAVARAAAIARGQIAPPAPDARVPRRVLAVVERGLAAAPSARWPGMTALIDALTATARPRRWWLPAAVMAAALVAIAIAWLRPLPRAVPGCASIAAAVHAVWSPAEDDALRAREPGGGALAGAIDRRVAAWTALRAAACRDVAAGGTRAVAALPALTCLDQRLADLAAVIAIARAPGPLAPGLADGVDALPPLTACLDGPRFVQAEPQPAEPGLARRVAADRAALASADALTRLGRFDEAAGALDHLTTVDEFAPLAAEAAYVRAGTASARGDRKAATAAYRDAINRAAASHHAVVQVQALLDLAFTLADAAEQLDERARGEIDAMLGLAEATLRGLVRDVDLARHLHGNRAAIRVTLGDPIGAIEDGRAAVALAIEGTGADSGEALVAALNLGRALRSADRLGEAEAVLAPALAAADRRWPPTHVTARRLAEVLGFTRLARGDLASARPLIERSLAAAIAIDGADSSEADRQRLTLASLALEQGRARDSEEILTAALASLDRRGDGDTEQAAMTRANLAGAQWGQGRFAEAAATNAAALADFERIFGADHPVVIAALIMGAMIALDGGHPDRAEAPARRALALARTHLGDGPGLANPAATLALVLAVRGRAAEARALAAQALAVLPADDDLPAVRGEAELAMALALDRLGEPTAARTRAERAEAHLARAGVGAARDLARVRTWRAAHRRP